MSSRELVSQWRLVGGVTGLLAVAAYTMLVAVPLPDKVGAVVASMFGPLVGCASIGLYRVLAWQRESVVALLAAVANVAAGALVVAMLLVQIALEDAEDAAASLDASTERIFDHVHFGLDLSWDTFICLGTFLFGLAVMRRAGFGPWVGGAGMVIAAAVYAVNFTTFPEPPSESAVDLGPLIGLWYAIVSVLLLRHSAVESTPLEPSG